MCLIIDYKFLNWHLMRLSRVINIPPRAECSQAVKLFSITNTYNYSSKSISVEQCELILPLSLAGLRRGCLSLTSDMFPIVQQWKLKGHINSSSERCREMLICPLFSFLYLTLDCCKTLLCSFLTSQPLSPNPY